MAAIGAGAFVWDGQRIEEEELRRSAQALQQLEDPGAFPEQERGWEPVMQRERFRLWRRPIPGSALFQYRVFGSYTDVTPRQFFNVQLDTEYRKQWDSLVLKLDVVERDPATGSEVIHWVTQFPGCGASRDSRGPRARPGSELRIPHGDPAPPRLRRERLRLPADVQRQPPDRVPALLPQLDGVQRDAGVPGEAALGGAEGQEDGAGAEGLPEPGQGPRAPRGRPAPGVRLRERPENSWKTSGKWWENSRETSGKRWENKGEMTTKWRKNDQKMAGKRPQNGGKEEGKWRENGHKMAGKWKENGGKKFLENPQENFGNGWGNASNKLGEKKKTNSGGLSQKHWK
ncbi:stAR-related lipid transfer protein 7, mitochondrial isoform X1 [Ammospiza nelsoni]|uniref:stAR-related lipid transfer protein 7, mitochondrial isoform X1 n=1 Tax=Ammospiza nelsoni TaxID=2857394 RepID=UPI00286B9B65|nr:stAR-related lipid transfer protein 7, mitochondrial isoform X1 [Ammospiza nelsoni]